MDNVVRLHELVGSHNAIKTTKLVEVPTTTLNEKLKDTL
jgi:hypothetical protein